MLGAGAAALAVIALIAVLALSGDDDAPSTEEIVEDVTPSTVLVRVSGLQGAGAGSGWVLDAEEGLIVTNFHVINGGGGFTVASQTTAGDAKVVGAAPCEDLAVLKVEDTEGLKTLPMGSQDDLKQGAGVVAIGYPANASNEDKLTSTAGVVSVVESSFRFDAPDSPQFPNVVQTDAALNPGNSGGPLVDEKKRLVGVNTAILTSAQGAPVGGQGYAIGVDRVKTVVEELREGRSRAWAGFGFLFATDEQAKKEGLPADGVIVSPALPGTGAEGADIPQEGALLLAIGGEKLEGTLADYCLKASKIEPGQTVPVTLPTSRARSRGPSRSSSADRALDVVGVEQTLGARVALVLDPDDDAGQVRVVARPVAEPDRLVDPGAGVGQAAAARQIPALVVARPRAGAVGVAEDDVARVDAERVDRRRHRAQPRAAQLDRRQLRAERAEPQPVERADRQPRPRLWRAPPARVRARRRRAGRSAAATSAPTGRRRPAGGRGATDCASA